MNRKVCLILLGLVLLALPACGARVDEPEAVEPLLLEERLFQWEADGYPDDVGGVYYDNSAGWYVLMLAGADEKRTEWYRSALTGEYGIESVQYSMNELRAVQSEIEQSMRTDPDGGRIYGVGIGWNTLDGEPTGFGPGGNEFRVVASVDASAYERLSAEWRERYGDKVFVEEGEPVVLD